MAPARRRERRSFAQTNAPTFMNPWVAWVPMYIGICPWAVDRHHGKAAAFPCHASGDLRQSTARTDLTAYFPRCWRTFLSCVRLTRFQLPHSAIHLRIETLRSVSATITWRATDICAAAPRCRQLAAPYHRTCRSIDRPEFDRSIRTLFAIVRYHEYASSSLLFCGWRRLPK